ncbi:hypothetical protein [Pleomorphomonas carboxyditropha]|uniref:hypothetical protein n=1 Tax=Pleomorphomonas carboxyditropha TaxID=2023338 RepID=UPI00105424CE|nr:hypothetical protein [Pleomorphomonas carboxyditropha]
MPGHNHYTWCMCGWCYKARTGGYAAERVFSDFDKSYAKRILKEYSADKRYSACFVNPNASCPVCLSKVFYYQNSFGSRVFFDELGWPWPKHACTSNASPQSSPYQGVASFPLARKRGLVKEILEAAIAADFDPTALFRERYGHTPPDLAMVIEVRRIGFENYIKARYISPPIDEPIYLLFTSEKIAPAEGDYFSFSEGAISIICVDTLQPQRLGATLISESAFAENSKKDRLT